MIVTKGDLKNGILEKFMRSGCYGLDTETNGLRWWGGDRLFSIILADEEDSYYFNFSDKPDHLGNYAPQDNILSKEAFSEFSQCFSNPGSTWFAHNAKFDIGMLSKDGMRVGGTIHCTEAVARLLDSSHFSYSLDNCVKRMNADLKIEGVEKDNAVDKYILEHKLFTWETIPGKKKRFKNKHFYLVPFDVIAPYGVTDGVTVRNLGEYQRGLLNGELKNKHPMIRRVAHQERALTKVLFDMEEKGVQLDVAYTKKAQDLDVAASAKSKFDFYQIAGVEYVDSGKVFKEVFNRFEIPYPQTAKGNASFDKNSLETVDHPVARTILDIRKAEKRVSSYYSNFLYFLNREDETIHADFRQAGTVTGRMSVRDPALQTIPKGKADIDEEEVDTFNATAVRRCFVPFKNHCFFMPDYDQMEYRMMVDIAGETELIDKIINEGLDVHTATAEIVSCSRKEAKTINFLLLYGGGAQKLADALGKSINYARGVKSEYFRKLPNVKDWSQRVIAHCKRNGYVENWAGRVCKIDAGFSYKAPNYIIQGGCADLVKKAMIEIDKLLTSRMSSMCLQIHDELIFNLHCDELGLAPKIVEIMETVYPHKYLPLTAGPGYSWKSLGDKIDGYPA